MDFNYDKVANALYFRLTSQEIFTTEEISEDILLDYDKKGKLVGIEILNFTKKTLILTILF
jgi:uncharacterized protein YuzE